MNSFESDRTINDLSEVTVIDTPTYLLARDEDCENAFHSTADFMNVFLVKSVLNIDARDMQVMLFDKHPDGPFFELIEKVHNWLRFLRSISFSF